MKWQQISLALLASFFFYMPVFAKDLPVNSPQNVLTAGQLVNWCEQVPLMTARDLGNTPNNIANAAACLGYLQGWLDAQIIMHTAYVLPDHCQINHKDPKLLAELFLKAMGRNAAMRNKPAAEAMNFALLPELCRVNSP